MLEEIEHFFVSYHALGKKPFRPLARRGPRRAEKTVAAGMRDFLRSTGAAGEGSNGRLLTVTSRGECR